MQKYKSHFIHFYKTFTKKLKFLSFQNNSSNNRFFVINLLFIYMRVYCNFYCDLIDATGRAIIAGKAGSILIDLPPILKQLNLNESTWLDEFRNDNRVNYIK